MALGRAVAAFREMLLRFRGSGFSGRLAAAQRGKALQGAIEVRVQFVQRLEHADADNAVGHDVAGEGFERVTEQFGDVIELVAEGIELLKIFEVARELGHVEIGRERAGAILEGGDSLLAERSRFVAHLDQALALIGRETDGAGAEGGLDGLQGGRERRHVGGGEVQGSEVLGHGCVVLG